MSDETTETTTEITTDIIIPEVEVTSPTHVAEPFEEDVTQPSTETTEHIIDTIPAETVHSHKYTEATCTTPKTCSVCGETSGKASGHNWKSATCQTPKTCKVCKITEGVVGDHNWKAATCQAPKTCKSCGSIEGSATDHKWKDATYSSPKKCSTCGTTSGDALEKPGKENYHGHVYTGGSSSKRFHYEAECAGVYSHEISWSEVDKKGLTPCKTCVLN